MTKSNHKIIEYVNIQHCLTRTKTLKLLEAIILEMMWKRTKSLKKAFPHSILYLEKISGISRHTIKVYMDKFEALNVIYYKSGKYFFKIDYDVFKEKLNDLDMKTKSKETKHSSYTCYNFELARQLNINEMQFFFLDIHFGLFLKKKYGTSPREYIMSILNIKKSYYFRLKKELFEKGYLEFYQYPDLIKLSDKVILSIVNARKRTI